MLSRLEIENFQSHDHSVLEFDPGVNIIIGSSDSGKSAIIRALKKVTWNKPSGDEMKSHWGGICKIAVLTMENDTVIWQRHKTSLYRLNDTEFKAFGNDVPEEIKNTLQLNEINLQQQLDAPFLLSNSAGEVALHFNKIAHLEKIHIGQKNIEKWLRQVQSDLESNRTQLKEKEQELQKYDYLDKMEKDVEVLEREQEQAISLYNSQSRLKELLKNIEEVEQKLNEKSQILKVEEQVNEILQCYKDLEKLKQEQSQLKEFYKDIHEVDNDIEYYETLVSDEQQVNDVIQLYERQKQLKEQGNNLYKLIKNVKYTRSELVEKKKILKTKEQEFETQFPNICPLCNTNLKEK